MADLTTLADVKAWLSITSSSEDTILSGLVSSVSAWVQQIIGRQIAPASYTEMRSGPGNAIMLNQYPVLSVESVTDGITPIVARPAYGQPGYYVANDTLYLDGGRVFCRGNGNIVVQYTAGYVAIPNDLAQATKQLVALRYKERDRIGQTSKSIQGETVSFDIKELPLDVRSVLNNYKRVVWGA